MSGIEGNGHVEWKAGYRWRELKELIAGYGGEAVKDGTWYGFVSMTYGVRSTMSMKDILIHTRK